MAKYLRPRRGTQSNALAQNIKLQKGELFMEFPVGNIGKSPGRLVVGDGASSYSTIKYQPGDNTSFQPFITDPSIYVPRFENSNPQTGNYTFDPAIEEINNIGNGSTAGEKLPNIIGRIKGALVKHANSLNNHETIFDKISETGITDSTPRFYTEKRYNYDDGHVSCSVSRQDALSFFEAESTGSVGEATVETRGSIQVLNSHSYANYAGNWSSLIDYNHNSNTKIGLYNYDKNIDTSDKVSRSLSIYPYDIINETTWDGTETSLLKLLNRNFYHTVTITANASSYNSTMVDLTGILETGSGFKDYYVSSYWLKEGSATSTNLRIYYPSTVGIRDEGNRGLIRVTYTNSATYSRTVSVTLVFSHLPGRTLSPIWPYPWKPNR